MNPQEYQEYIQRVTPTHSVARDCIRAFFTGGAICLLGQALNNCFARLGADKDTAAAFMQLCLIVLSILLTGFNIFPKIARFGGAGALVPITGFANSVAAPAIEFQKEGQVFGIGCKIFTIAGPVILYGLFSSWVLGLIYWVLKLAGIV
ncbi:MAG: stage V sporulation protein AC [Lachnospiraceae bacterium]|nr:stage V sporulation protein AC [Lachnospiraceae bacterium]